MNKPRTLLKREKETLTRNQPSKEQLIEYAAEGWAWVGEYCNLLDVPDVFAARKKLKKLMEKALEVSDE